VPAEREGELLAGYRRLNENAKPDGLLRSELLRADGGRWLIQTLWRDKEAILAARRAGQPPAALVLLDGVGAAVHSHDVWTVADSFGA
jgi:hypothetical protein